ncbi:MAG TPA: adenylate/guanylate cyclase domain-containing protein [Gaiellaceae bacterium]|nr:adenylate/guanylate cyclase domain-containing protein [Gaiellaceae bacterium]
MTSVEGTAAEAAAAERRASRLTALGVRLLTLGADPRDSADERARKSLLVAVCLMVLPAGVLWGALYLVFDEPIAALFPWSYTVVSCACLVAFARSGSFRFLRTVELSLILVTPAALSVVLGGLTESSGVVIWSFLAPVGAVVFSGPARAWRWFGGFLLLLGATIALGPAVRPDGADLPEGARLAFAGLNLGAVSFVAFALLVSFARQREHAQQRVESLLLNILPDEIAQRLQAEPQAIADHFEEASILFADVVDFTPLSERLGPRELVGLLDRLFTSFDDLADRYGVEKIKTIGDCYMVAAGVPRPRADHAHALARMALEMRERARDCLPDPGERNLQLRIGISSGPVVAGVIGRRRFLYDLWGDTVNMASRMESHGSPDAIQITRTTWELLRDDFATEPRGPVEVKGKGRVETWYLLGPRT